MDFFRFFFPFDPLRGWNTRTEALNRKWSTKGLHDSKFRQNWKLGAGKRTGKAQNTKADGVTEARHGGIKSLKSLSASTGRALLYISAVVFPPLYSQNNENVVELQTLPLQNQGDVVCFFFFCLLSWSRGCSADKEHTCSIYAEIVIHQTEKRVITNEGI